MSPVRPLGIAACDKTTHKAVRLSYT